MIPLIFGADSALIGASPLLPFYNVSSLAIIGIKIKGWVKSRLFSMGHFWTVSTKTSPVLASTIKTLLAHGALAFIYASTASISVNWMIHFINADEYWSGLDVMLQLELRKEGKNPLKIRLTRQPQSGIVSKSLPQYQFVFTIFINHLICFTFLYARLPYHQ